MAGEFDPVRALREEITGLRDVRQVIAVRLREAEDEMTKAESKAGAFRKLLGFADAEIERKREVLSELERQSREEGK